MSANEVPTKDLGARLAEYLSEPDIDATVALRQASEIPVERISWLWSGWLARGKLHMLGGAPGTGKTTIALSLAAVISKGGQWPDGTPFMAAGNVIMWSGEDDAADTLVPRLSAMGADLGKVHIVSDVTDPDGRRPFDPAHDMPSLIAKARELGEVGLLIIDPVVMTVAGDSHKNAEVRRGLAPLVTFAQKLDAAVLGVTHFSKGTSGREPLDRLTGSLAFGAAPRLVFAAARTKDDSGQDTDNRVFVRVKSNIGPDGGALTYSLNTRELPQGIVTSRITWGGQIEGKARDILANAEQSDVDRDEDSALGEATQCLGEILGDGQLHEANEVIHEARSAGHAERTIRRAREALRIRPERNGKTRKWYWRLPAQQDGHSPRRRNDGHLGHLGPNDRCANGVPPLAQQDGQGGHDSEFGGVGPLGGVEVFS
jgi:RecA-family ATPase